MGSNGLTSARHDMFSNAYTAKYPESFDEAMPKELAYTGKLKLTDQIDGIPVDMGKLVLSPTRTYLPLLKPILDEYRDKVHGMIHNTGGGQTKCLHFSPAEMHIIKDDLFETPALFRLIHEQSTAEWKEMYRVFNMGHLLEIYTDEKSAEAMISISAEFGIEAKIIGRCESSSQKKLTILSKHGQFEY